MLPAAESTAKWFSGGYAGGTASTGSISELDTAVHTSEVLYSGHCLYFQAFEGSILLTLPVLTVPWDYLSVPLFDDFTNKFPQKTYKEAPRNRSQTKKHYGGEH